MSDPFFAFPLPLIGFDRADFTNTIQNIVSYCIIEVGTKAAEEMDEDELERERDKLKTHPTGLNWRTAKHRAAVIGSRILNVNMSSVTATLSRHSTAAAFIAEREQAHGPSPLVFIGASLLWGTHGGTGLSWRAFSVLCAVNSVIGKTRKKPVRITRDMILARTQGHKRPADATEPPTMTVSELRTALDQLELAGFFVRVTPSPRRTYFVREATRDEARSMVAEMLKRQRSGLKAEREADRLIGSEQEL